MRIQHFFDPDTFTLSYVVSDPATRDAVLIDPVLDYDPASGEIGVRSSQEVVKYIRDAGLNLRAILETHAHADHLSGSQVFKRHFPEAILAIGEKIRDVQAVFKGVFNATQLKTDGSQFDRLLKDFEETSFGSLKMKAIPTPGHTPACLSFLFGDALFTGDALFMPDYGTGRCDFPKGSARALFQSVTQNLYTLPDSTRVFVGHDYLPNGREMRFQTTIGESKRQNIQLRAETAEAEYIRFRESRDKTLSAPRLLLPSVQVNIDAGHLPRVESNGVAYLKMPLRQGQQTMLDAAYDKDGVPTLHPENVFPTPGWQLIDVRTEEEFHGELGHIAGSRLVTVGEDLEQFLKQTNPTAHILFVCRSGARSGRATQSARNLGFKTVFNMDGGMLKWNELGLPIER